MNTDEAGYWRADPIQRMAWWPGVNPGSGTKLSAGGGVAWWWAVGRGTDEELSASLRRRRVLL